MVVRVRLANTGPLGSPGPLRNEAPASTSIGVAGHWRLHGAVEAARFFIPEGRTSFIALTDKAWFDFLSAHAERGCIDEVNFWSPQSTSPMKTMAPGEPIFFRLAVGL